MVSSTPKHFQNIFEGEIWCLCTLTFGQTFPKLNSRLVYCWRLYGIFTSKSLQIEVHSTNLLLWLIDLWEYPCNLPKVLQLLGYTNISPYRWKRKKKEKENLLIAAKKRTRIKIYFWQLMLVGGPVWLAVTSCAMKIDLFKYLLLVFWKLKQKH